MQRLIITAHPSSKGFTHKIASQIVKANDVSWIKTQIIDLYDKKYYQDYLNFENVEEEYTKPTEIKTQIQELITKSDELIFIFPIWWWDMPAVLKNFYDVNFTAWYAFKYEKWWRVNWLLKWKTAKIYATCDAPWLFYKIFPIRLSWLWWFARLWFCGVKLTKFKLIDKMRKKSENELNVILEQIYAENK